jgi:predicted PurR-regulated permease PerM
MLANFFKHTNGSNWWGISKYSFIIASAMNAFISLYGYTQHKSHLGFFIGIFIASTFYVYVQTLTASCLKTSKCGILASISIIGIVIYILVAGIVAINGLEYFIRNRERFEQEEEEEL